MLIEKFTGNLAITDGLSQVNKALLKKKIVKLELEAQSLNQNGRNIDEFLTDSTREVKRRTDIISSRFTNLKKFRAWNNF